MSMIQHPLSVVETIVVVLAAFGLFCLITLGSAVLLWCADRLDGHSQANPPTTWIYDQTRQRYLPRAEDP
jgi:hypothetical protein